MYLFIHFAYGTVFLQNISVNAFIHYNYILPQAFGTQLSFKWCFAWASDLIEKVALYKEKGLSLLTRLFLTEGVKKPNPIKFLNLDFSASKTSTKQTCCYSHRVNGIFCYKGPGLVFFLAMIKIVTKSNLGRKKIHYIFCFPIHQEGKSGQERKAATRREELKQGPQRNSGYRISPPALLNLLLYNSQDHQIRVGALHSGVGNSTSITNEENMLPACLYASLMWVFSQLSFLLLRYLWFVSR